MCRDKTFVLDLLKKNEATSVHKKPHGLLTKLFHCERYYNKKAMVKTYMFRPYNEKKDRTDHELYQEMILANFIDEIVFQKYAKQIGAKLSFLVPDIYSYGKIHYCVDENGENVWCCYIIMEYMDGLLLKDAVFSRDTIRDVYEYKEEIEEIDSFMKRHMLHHNDLHSENIMLMTQPNGTHKVAVLDFGEAALGPRKPISRNPISRKPVSQSYIASY